MYVHNRTKYRLLSNDTCQRAVCYELEVKEDNWVEELSRTGEVSNGACGFRTMTANGQQAKHSQQPVACVSRFPLIAPSNQKADLFLLCMVSQLRHRVNTSQVASLDCHLIHAQKPSLDTNNPNAVQSVWFNEQHSSKLPTNQEPDTSGSSMTNMPLRLQATSKCSSSVLSCRTQLSCLPFLDPFPKAFSLLFTGQHLLRILICCRIVDFHFGLQL